MANAARLERGKNWRGGGAGAYSAFMRTLTGSIALLLLSACGFTSPGGGTGTLFVTARLTSDGSTAGSRARITVRAGSSTGDIVNNAEVAIRGGALARTTVPFDGGNGNNTQYRLDGFTWVEGFRLEVIRGNDKLDGSIDAPGPTLITNPISDSTFKKADGQPLIVTWKDTRNAPAHATQVRFDKANLDQAIPDGVLELRVDPANLKVDKETVRVDRTNEIALAGGSAGSVLSASTTHEIEFRVE